MLQIIPHKKISLTISVILVLASILSVVFWGLKLGIDFTGGTYWEVEFLNARPDNTAVLEALSGLGLKDIVTQPTGETGLILRLKDIPESVHHAALQSLNAISPVKDIRFESIGPTIGQELKTKAVSAIFLVLVLIIIYIAWAFRKVSQPVSSWKYGVIAVIALMHDVFIPAGVFAILGHYKGVEIDTLFVTALLTVLGFSVHDTIVVFDRIRENLHRRPHEDFAENVNKSVNETFARSINTSLTVFLVLLAVYFLGGQSTQNFALTLIIGVFFGTYSSIFVASPLLVIWSGIKNEKGP
ncbi:MAG: protein translocase subunit SecF [Patescibacteria group bacterium]